MKKLPYLLLLISLKGFAFIAPFKSEALCHSVDSILSYGRFVFEVQNTKKEEPKILVVSSADIPGTNGHERWTFGYRDGHWKYWSNFDICTGSGACTLTAMGVHSPGDVANIVNGSYSSGNFSNLTGITITYKTARGNVAFTGTVTMGSNLGGTNLTGISFTGTNGISFQNNNSDLTVSNSSFIGVTGDVMNSNNGRAYTGATSSFTLYQCHFDSLYLSGCGYFHRGSFGQIGDGTNFTDSITYTNIRIIQTVTNGEQVRGVGFRVKADNWFVSYTGTNPSGGDVGLFTLFGNGVMKNCYSYGMAGYMFRNYTAKLIGTSSVSMVYNCVKAEGKRYGLASFRIDASNIVPGTSTACDQYQLNTTEYNCIDDGGYISPLQVWGSSAGATLHMKNNVAVINQTAGSHILQNDSGGNGSLDTSNNVYYSSNTPSGTTVLDVTGGFPTYKPASLLSPIVGTGTNVGLVTDFYGIAYSVPPPKGFAMFNGSPPPVTPCSCMPRPRGGVVFK